RRVRHGRAESLTGAHVLNRDRPDVGTGRELGDIDVYLVARCDCEVRDGYPGGGDELVPRGIGSLARGVDVLLGAGLDQARIGRRATSVDAPAADADPRGRETRLAAMGRGRGN